MCKALVYQVTVTCASSPLLEARYVCRRLGVKMSKLLGVLCILKERYLEKMASRSGVFVRFQKAMH